MSEEYRPIPDFPSYELSDLGNVRILDSSTWKSKINQLKKPTLREDGYYYITLRKDNKPHTFSIHKLVASVFLDNPFKDYSYYFIEHIDKNKLNNNKNNLRYTTYKKDLEKIQQEVKEKNKRCRPKLTKLNESLVKQIKEEYQTTKLSQKKLADKYNVSASLLSLILSGKRW